jgi:hypothetical protein
MDWPRTDIAIAITMQKHLLMAGFKGLKSKAQSAANTRGISSICNAVKRVLETRQKWVFLSRDGYTSHHDAKTSVYGGF